MSEGLSVKWLGQPPAWVTKQEEGRLWYHENEHGDQWVAHWDGSTLRIATSDTGWEEVSMTPEQVESGIELMEKMDQMMMSGRSMEEVAASLADYIVPRPGKPAHPVMSWMLSNGEKFWLRAVLHTTRASNQAVAI